MAVNAGYAPLTYEANGVTTDFPVTWPFSDKAHVIVERMTDGSPSPMAGYSVIQTPEGGTVRFAEAPDAGTIRVSRNTALRQPDVLRYGGAMAPPTLEKMIDRPVMMVQELEARIENIVLEGGGLPPNPVEDQVVTWKNGEPVWLEPAEGDAVLRADLASNASGKGVDLVDGATASTDLASAMSGKGSDLVAARETLASAAAYLKTVSDVMNAGEIELFRAIPKAQWANINAGTSVYDAAANTNALLAEMAARGGTVILPHGKLNIASGLSLDYSGYESDEGNTRIAIRGQGAKSSEIKLTDTNGTALSVVGAWPHSTSLELSSFRITAAVGLSRALKLNGVAHISLYDVVMRGAYVGLDCTDVLALQWINSSIAFCTLGMTAVRNNKTFPNLYNMMGGGIGGCGYYALRVDGGCLTNLTGMGFEGNGGSVVSASEGWGVKLIDPGTEGRNAANINNCYFEGNKGQADVWLDVPSHDVAVNINGNTFNRLSSTHHTTNNVRLATSASGKIQASLAGNGFFRAGDYSADTNRKTVLGVGADGSINLDLGANSYSDLTIDGPWLAQTGRMADSLKATPQAWARIAADGTVQSGSQVQSCVRNGTGDFTVNFTHGITAAKCYQVTFDHNEPVFMQVFSETSNSVQFLFRTAASVLTNPSRFYLTVFG